MEECLLCGKPNSGGKCKDADEPCTPDCPICLADEEG